MFSTFDTVAAETSLQEFGVNEFLLNTGMSQEDINKIDPDFRTYIVENLKENAQLQTLEFINTEEIPTLQPRSSEVLSGITFTVSSWKSGGIIYIYPTYEFTTAKRPRGKDSFSFQLGDAMAPYDFGGKIWHRRSKSEQWSSDASDTMIANQQTLSGAEYSGTQLGTPDFNIYIKGCAYAYANAGSGTDKRIVMNYMYNPNGASYSISFSVHGIGVSYSSPSTVYTASKIATLLY